MGQPVRLNTELSREGPELESHLSAAWEPSGAEKFLHRTPPRLTSYVLLLPIFSPQLLPSSSCLSYGCYDFVRVKMAESNFFLLLR